MKKVFIDGKAGTTGLRIYDRLADRSDIQLITLSDEHRKDIKFRKEALNDADIAFLCLPDAAAIEAVGLIENPNTVVLDTSTAHRTESGWAYGFPELSDDIRNSIANGNRIAVPGCHASGFIALVKPLIDADIISADTRLICQSLSGYSGAGKKAIQQYECSNDNLLSAPRAYALTQQHKHLKEMKAITGLNEFPVFCPLICNYYSGMMVTVSLFKKDLQNEATTGSIREIYKNKYNGPIVNYSEHPDEDGFMSAVKLSGKDTMEISVNGNDDRITLTARYDNLGKGASGAAVQCMNILLGSNETQGLDL